MQDASKFQCYSFILQVRENVMPPQIFEFLNFLKTFDP